MPPPARQCARRAGAVSSSMPQGVDSAPGIVRGLFYKMRTMEQAMTIPIHSLNLSHLDLLKRHFDELADDDVQLRFGSLLNRDARHAYVDSIRFERDAVFGVYSDDLSLLGVAHLACMVGAAELGLSVLSPYRGNGIGTALFNRAAMRARNLQIVDLFMNCLAQNGAIMHLARKAGMRIIVDHSGADAYLELPPGNPLTLGQELAEQQFAQFDWTLKTNVNYLRSVTRT
jgi:GNAT superfamily N-acetyltransferase